MSLLGAPDVAAWLKYSATPTGAELVKFQATIDAAEGYIAQKKGMGPTLGPNTIAQRAPGFGDQLVLTRTPVISVTSVTDPAGTVVPLVNLDVNLAHGLIGYNVYGYGCWPAPWYTVTYQAGFANLAALPPAYQQAVREVTREFWGAQRGGSAPSAGGAPDAGSARSEADRIIATLPSYGFA